MTRAIVLISGGIDSAVALSWAIQQGLEVTPLTVDYHLRAAAEKAAVREILKRTGIGGLIEVPMAFLKEAADLKNEGASGPYLRESPDGYIPARNMVFYSVAAFYAEALGADVIVGGHNRDDPDEFPDSSPRFFEQMNRLMETGLWSYSRKPVKILLPLRGKTKADVLRLGVKLGTPLELTWSCRQDGKEHCGECSSCVEREDAFASIGVEDPRPRKRSKGNR